MTTNDSGTPKRTSNALTRRTLLRRAGQAGVGAGVAWWVPDQAVALTRDPRTAATTATGRRASVRIREGTNMAAAASPNSDVIAIDLLGVLWLVDRHGGPARQLGDELSDATQPAWSPDGASLFFQSYRTGNYHLWRASSDGTDLEQLTDGPFDHREPAVSPDGSQLAFVSDRAGEHYDLYTMDLGSGEIRAWSQNEGEEGQPAWLPDGNGIAVTVDDTSIVRVDSDGTREELVAAQDDVTVFGPSFSPAGALAYVRMHGPDSDLVVYGDALTSGEDVFAFPASWLDADTLVYTADGRVKQRRVGRAEPREIRFTAGVQVGQAPRLPSRRGFDDDGDLTVRGIASPVASPDGDRVAFRALGSLWILPIGGRPERIIEADTPALPCNPDWSPDGQTLVYSSDRAGSPDLWLYEIQTGEHTRLTDRPGAALTPRWSPGGDRIAYQDHDGVTYVYEVDSGESEQVLPELFLPGRPTWSADGRTLALAAVHPYSGRYREGTSQILTVSLDDGEVRYQEPLPHRSLSTRGDDGPVFSPDGSTLAFVVESVLWVVDVAGDGTLEGEPRQLTDELTDAPSWAGNDTLIYLSGGTLRRIALSGGAPETLDVPLSYRRQVPSERYVVHAGALWDGRRRGLRRDVDIVVDGNRIAAVEPHDPERDAPVIDASDRTVMPGLIDAHNHCWLRGREWGARQGHTWLAYGITSTRSPGDPVYQAIEEREAVESGDRIGPRFFASGEAVDGGRVYYDFMRTTRSSQQLELELERATSLDYDLLKTYVRLPDALQQEAVAAIHDAGIPVTSHYLFPSVTFGIDGMEHMGATNRLGYSQTQSRLGYGYEDVRRLLAAAGTSITPTLFDSRTLYAKDDSLVTDPRTATLYPAWEYEDLLETRDEARDVGDPEQQRSQQAVQAQVDTLREIMRRGGWVIAGTDAPLDHVAISLHVNLRAMVRYGMRPFEALTTATRNAAWWLGLDEELGAVAPGYLADLAIVEGNPLRDITAAAAVTDVVVGGVHHEVATLTDPFEDGSTASRSQSRQPRVGPGVASRERFWWHGEAERHTRVCCSG